MANRRDYVGLAVATALVGGGIIGTSVAYQDKIKDLQNQIHETSEVTTLAVEPRDINGDGLGDLVVTLTNGERVFLLAEERGEKTYFKKVILVEELEELNKAYEENSDGFY